MPIVRGPFRGARVLLRPRVSLRKVLGVYEHELNGWLERALDRCRRVIDVGANDGYFTFGCASAMRRRGNPVDIIAFEPQEYHLQDLRSSIGRCGMTGITLIPKFVGSHDDERTVTLDGVCPESSMCTLVKLDIEGAEYEALRAGTRLINENNLFVIEVHREALQAPIMELFRAHGCPLKRIDHFPHRVLGAERRDGENYWLVTPLE